MVDTIKLYLEYSIIGVLCFMSFLTLWFALERYFFLSRVKINNFKKKGELENALTNNLTTISTIASNAPYIGLFGTVCGIMITFYKISENSNFDTNSVMLGLALALKATAIGILVAIFATIIYNGLARKVDVLMTRWEDLDENEKFDSMNVIPFIDIMLVLLAIVLTFSTFIAQGRVELKLPKSTTTEKTDLKLKELIIDAKGKIIFDEKDIQIEELKEVLSILPKTTNISLKADENTPFKTFVKVVDIFKELKLEKISIVTELKK